MNPARDADFEGRVAIEKKGYHLRLLECAFRSSDLGAVFGFFVRDSTLVSHPIKINLIISIGMFFTLNAMLSADDTE